MPHTLVAPRRRRARRDEPCTASGWAVLISCTDRAGHIICPVCDEVVGAPRDPDLGPRVCVIASHRRGR